MHIAGFLLLLLEKLIIYSGHSRLLLTHKTQPPFSVKFTASISVSMAAQIRWNYDVFLSFRGEDTRKTFTDHLYTALRNAGICTFRDDDDLPRGEYISTKLRKAIQESKVSIVVFSKGYASSSWCLDELVEIVRCKNSISQTLLPIFYDVNPSDVRKQTGTFAEAFAGHADRFQAEMERVHKWRTALTEAANISGWDLQDVANGYYICYCLLCFLCNVIINILFYFLSFVFLLNVNRKLIKIKLKFS
ncbi:TMV resistance protein N-like [Corylus avellana]|uniref:TMV resistance protein N-like n=1 Tax=Corylus avellana TaxID=13451 RepID=UPI00286A88CF|nr:TMV resistance protein N-like [Corylus avellana]